MDPRIDSEDAPRSPSVGVPGLPPGTRGDLPRARFPAGTLRPGGPPLWGAARAQAASLSVGQALLQGNAPWREAREPALAFDSDARPWVSLHPEAAA